MLFWFFLSLELKWANLINWILKLCLTSSAEIIFLFLYLLLSDVIIMNKLPLSLSLSIAHNLNVYACMPEKELREVTRPLWPLFSWTQKNSMYVPLVSVVGL